MQRFGAAIGVVGVDHERHPKALDGRMDGGHHLDIITNAEAELDLHVAKAVGMMTKRLLDKTVRLAGTIDAVKAGRIGFDVAPERSAEQLPYRLAMDLTHNVPQGDVDAADGSHDRPLAAEVARPVVHGEPQTLCIKRVLADDHVGKTVANDRCRDMRHLEALAEGLAPADKAVVGTDFDKRRHTRIHPSLRKGERGFKRRPKWMNMNGFDLHSDGSRLLDCAKNIPVSCHAGTALAMYNPPFSRVSGLTRFRMPSCTWTMEGARCDPGQTHFCTGPRQPSPIPFGRDIMLTASQQEFFAKNGYLVVEDVFDHDRHGAGQGRVFPAFWTILSMRGSPRASWSRSLPEWTSLRG